MALDHVIEKLNNQFEEEVTAMCSRFSYSLLSILAQKVNLIGCFFFFCILIVLFAFYCFFFAHLFLYLSFQFLVFYLFLPFFLNFLHLIFSNIHFFHFSFFLNFFEFISFLSFLGFISFSSYFFLIFLLLPFALILNDAFIPFSSFSLTFF